MADQPPLIPHHLTKNVKLLQKAALFHKGKVLLLQRATDAHSRPENWDLPGGNSEWPQTDLSQHGLHQADIAREIKEETGIMVPEETFDFDACSYFNTYFDAANQIFSVMVGWQVILPDNSPAPEVTISHEHTAMAWVDVATLDDYDFGGTVGQFVKDIILG